MEPNTLTRREYKGKIYVENIRKNSCRILNRIRIRNQLKSRDPDTDPDPKRIITDPQNWL
jgi:hypothetical protein